MRANEDYPTAVPFLPDDLSLPVLQEAVQGCKGCDLYLRATQAVFGEGPKRAKMLMVGEQPGDQEDLAGKPFVGPAGKLLDQALDEAGVDRTEVYVTNAVKHFKWEERGKRRIHSKPSSRQVAACRPWLDAEMASVQPQLVVCLGATAAQALLGPAFKVTQHRGEILHVAEDIAVMATVHPSSLLRMPDREARQAAYADLVKDLKKAGKFVSSRKT